MSLRRELLVSFIVQGLGAASVLLATLWLGLRLGPEVQGGFSRTKAEVEFIAAFAMFGLPQALFFHVKSGGLNGRAALRWVGWSALLAAPIGALYAVVQHGAAGVWMAALGVAAAALVAQGELRALLLVRDRTVWFNAVTAAPQVLVLCGVVGVVWLVSRLGSGVGVGVGAGAGVGVGVGVEASAAFEPRPASWLWLFALAFGVTAAWAWWRLRAAPLDPSPSTVEVRTLARYGLAAWLAAALSTAAILAMQHGVEASAGRAALGRFTLAMTLVQVPLTPIAYAAPLLFRRWMEAPGAAASRLWSAWLFAALLGLAAFVWLGSLRWGDLGLGPAYAGAAEALAVLLVGGAAEASSRVLTVQASASGLPWIAVRAEAARWGVLALGGVAVWLSTGSQSTDLQSMAWQRTASQSMAWQTTTSQATAWQSALPHALPWLCAIWSAAALAAAAVFVWHGRGAKVAE